MMNCNLSYVIWFNYASCRTDLILAKSYNIIQVQMKVYHKVRYHKCFTWTKKYKETNENMEYVKNRTMKQYKKQITWNSKAYKNRWQILAEIANKKNMT